MLLTPRVLSSQKDAQGVTADFVDKFTERGNVKKEELHWVKPPKESQGQQENNSGNTGK
jgi:hypothetical protein